MTLLTFSDETCDTCYTLMSHKAEGGTSIKSIIGSSTRQLELALRLSAHDHLFGGATMYSCTTSN